MVEHVLQLVVHAEVEHERRGRVFELRTLAASLEVLVRRFWQQAPVSVGQVCADEHGVGGKFIPVYPHAPRPAFGDQDFLDRAVKVELYAKLLSQLLHRLDERVHAALREPQAVLGHLGVGEERVDRRRPERRESQVHGLEAERLAQLVGLEES